RGSGLRQAGRSAQNRFGTLTCRVPKPVVLGGPVPTYQYACTECGHRFEAVQAFSDNALTSCPECSGKLRKVYGSVGVVFKGSGFYRNDARGDSKSTSTLTTKSKDSAGKDSSSSSSSSDSSTSTSATPAASTSPSSSSATTTSTSSSA